MIGEIIQGFKFIKNKINWLAFFIFIFPLKKSQIYARRKMLQFSQFFCQ
jgi:hypothetical protein